MYIVMDSNGSLHYGDLIAIETVRCKSSGTGGHNVSSSRLVTADPLARGRVFGKSRGATLEGRLPADSRKSPMKPLCRDSSR